MRVVSSLADIDFGIGRITRMGADLVIVSSEDSTIPTRVTITPADALRSLRVLLTSPSVWLFVLRLPFGALRRAETANPTKAWEQRRRQTGLNKPW